MERRIKHCCCRGIAAVASLFASILVSNVIATKQSRIADTSAHFPVSAAVVATPAPPVELTKLCTDSATCNTIFPAQQYVQLLTNQVHACLRSNIVRRSYINTPSAILITISLDGNVTALRSSDGVKLVRSHFVLYAFIVDTCIPILQWSVSTGKDLVQSVDYVRDMEERSAPAAGYTDALIIPSTDGRILVRTPEGLEALPERAQEMVAQVPISTADQLITGSKATKIMRVGVRSGRIAFTNEKLPPGGACPASAAECDATVDGDEPVIWLARTDFNVHAISYSTTRSVWNLTYSEVAPTDIVLATADDVQASLRQAGLSSDMECSELAASGQLPFFPWKSSSSGKVHLVSMSASTNGDLVALNTITQAPAWTYSSTSPVQAAYIIVDASAEERVRPLPLALSLLWPSLSPTRTLPAPEDATTPDSSTLTPADLSALIASQYGDEFGTLTPVTSDSAQFVISLTKSGQVYALPRIALSLRSQLVVSRVPAITASDTLLLAPPTETPPSFAFSGGQIGRAHFTAVGAAGYTTRYGLHNASTSPQPTSEPFALAPKTLTIGEIVALIWAGKLLLKDMDLPAPVLQALSGLVLIIFFIAIVVFVGSVLLCIAACTCRTWYKTALSNLSEALVPRSAGSRSPRRTLPRDDDTSVSPRVKSTMSPPASDTIIIDDEPHRIVGKLYISNTVIGKGCQGTIVYRGKLGQRDVAIKRMLRSHVKPSDARAEISVLIRTDKHPNVVRYYAYEETHDFMYLALELCSQSLAEAMHKCARSIDDGSRGNRYAIEADPDASASTTASTALSESLATARTAPVPTPSPATRRFLSELVDGVAYLHMHNIVHRDIKPHNILLAVRSNSAGIADRRDTSRLYTEHEHHTLGDSFAPKISDFGLSKLLVEDAASQYILSEHIKQGGTDTSTVVAPGSVGWQAPEVMQLRLTCQTPVRAASSLDDDGSKNGSTSAPHSHSGSDDAGIMSPASAAQGMRSQRSRQADIWSLGCVMHFVLDANVHPFGDSVSRELNIRDGRCDLSRLERIPEAHALILSMLAYDPTKRPTAMQVSEHPLLWQDDRRAACFCELSNYLEQLPDCDKLTAALEAHAAEVFSGAGWSGCLPQALLADSGRHRGYGFHSLVDLLRLFRNKHNHFTELPLKLRRDIIQSDSPHSLVPFFLSSSRFPRLLMVSYAFIHRYLAHESCFETVLGPNTVSAQREASRAALSKLYASKMMEPRREPAVKPLRAKSHEDAPSAASLAPARAATVLEPMRYRGWYGSTDEWSAAAAICSARALTETGGRIVPATLEKGEPATPSKPPVRVVTAHDRLAVTSFKGGAHVNGSLYKSKQCTDWEDAAGAACPRGVRCDYAHSAIELRRYQRDCVDSTYDVLPPSVFMCR